MEDVPPSYQSAIDREAWNVIAPWIPSSDLCSACLVSRKWHAIFVAFLWGDPASHFGIENDAVYVALTRFKRTLRKARLTVRALTHTLRLPPALSEIYGGPNPSWLREVLEYLPNLQSLIVSRLPFFDHHSLAALRHPIRPRRRLTEEKGEEEEEEIPVYGLKLLLATHEPNTTSASVAAALPCFQALVYLDLSYTSTARDAAVLFTLANLYDLQVLKLRGVGMRDGEAEVMANAIGIRVRLLDLRENLLTDMAVRSLMQACFVPPAADAPGGAQWTPRRIEDWPVGMAPGPDLFSLDTLRNEELDRELLKQLTNPLTGRLAFEDIPHRGLTHLYVAENHLSVEGVSSLLKSERLHVLDAGSVESVKTIARTQSLSSPTGYTDDVRFPGAEKLVPILHRSASKNLTYLRLDHAVVTEQLDVADDVPLPKSSYKELPGTAPLASELPADGRHILEAPAPAHYAVELPTDREPVYELDASPPEPRYELIGDIMQFAISPPVGDKPADHDSPAAAGTSPIRGEGPYAPEVVTDSHGPRADDPRPADVVRNVSGSRVTATKAASPPDPASPVSAPPPAISPAAASPLTAVPPSSSHRPSRIETLLQKRPAPLVTLAAPAREERPGRFTRNLSSLHPAALPNLRTLILTNVPTSVPPSSPVISRLKSFIAACADEAALAALRARVNYSLPPGRTRHTAEVEHARTLFALRCIVLEMAAPGSASAAQARGWHHNKQRMSMSKSSTGDHDSENLWSAAENDFSFFGEEGEEADECGIYDHDPEKYFPTAQMDGLIPVTPQESANGVDGSRGGRPRSSQGSISGNGVNAPVARSPTMLRSPRQLPLGRNRRTSSESDRERPAREGSLLAAALRASAPQELAGSRPPPPTSNPSPVSLLAPPTRPPEPAAPPPDEPMLDVVAELAAWRRQKKRAYEEAVLRWKMQRRSQSHMNGIDAVLGPAGPDTFNERDMPFVEGHWKGEIKIIRNAAPKGRTGVADIYGNYFEKGYLYP